MEFTTRPVVMGTNGMVTSSHYLATEIGHHALRRGGNVVDAAVSMWFALTLTKPDLVGIAGEVPILLYLSDDETVLAINGSGPAPKAATVEWFRKNDYPLIPEDGFTPAVIPETIQKRVANNRINISPRGQNPPYRAGHEKP
jgi:gamma-glutamyltranspeptidase/glutathione hydrolase